MASESTTTHSTLERAAYWAGRILNLPLCAFLSLLLYADLFTFGDVGTPKRFLLLGGAVFFLTRSFYLIVKGDYSSRVKNAALVVFSLVMALSVLEALFSFKARTSTNCFSFAHRVWVQRYWKPINTLGFRDEEWTAGRLAGRTRVLVLGDSFAAGWGISDVRDRFSGQLARRLGSRYAVMNAAMPAQDTVDEINTFRSYPFQPDIVVLAYFLNDIERVGDRTGLQLSPEGVKKRAGPVVYYLQAGSAFFNYLYWLYPRWEGRDFMYQYVRMYDNPESFSVHRRDLLRFVDLTAARKCRLIVVLFPLMNDLEGGRAALTKVEGVFRERGIESIDMIPLLKDLPSEKRMVNCNDVHPSLRVHEKVAEALASRIETMTRNR